MVNNSSAYQENNSINIYPNPNTGIFNIYIDNIQNENIEFKIFNSLGQVIFAEESIQVKETYYRQLDLKENPAGIYYLQILGVKGVINKQIIFK